MMANKSVLKQGLLTLMACILAIPPALARDLEGKLNVNGQTREYLLHIPDRLSSTEKVPLVMMLHGGGGGPQSIVRSSDMSAKADKEGFIAVYPAGVDTARGPIKGTWNADGCCGGAMRNDEQDIFFLDQLIDTIVATYNIDTNRIYLGGMSNGAMMSHRASAVLARKIAAVGLVSGAIFQSQPAARMPVSAIIFHGLKDDMVPYKGGISPNGLVSKSQSQPFKPTQESFAYWKAQDKCSGPVTVQKGSDFTAQFATGCASGTEVAFYTMHNGGHEWPRTDSTRGLIRGSSTPASFNATDLMWSFFKAHPKN